MNAKKTKTVELQIVGKTRQQNKRKRTLVLLIALGNKEHI